MTLNRNNGAESTFAASSSALSQKVSLWKSLAQGDKVSLRLRGFDIHAGTIEDRTPDGRSIWVTDHIGDRRLFHIDDNYDLVLAPQR